MHEGVEQVEHHRLDLAERHDDIIAVRALCNDGIAGLNEVAALAT
jgi:hypothetical protein